MVISAIVALALLTSLSPAQTPAPPTAPAPSSLTPAQMETLKKLLASSDTDSKARIQPTAEKITEIAKAIGRNVLAEKPDPELDKKLRADMTNAVLETVKIAMDIRLNAIADIAKVLTPDQKKFLLAELDKPETNPDLAELVQRRLMTTVP
jgi:hypothetical protein